MQFDVKSIVLIILIGQALSIIIFTYYLYFYHNSNPNIKYYTAGKVLQLIGVLISIIYAEQLTPLIMTMTLLFFYPGMAIEAYCLVYANHADKISKLYALLAISTIFIATYAIFAGELITRVVITSGYYSILFLFIFIQSIFSKTKSPVQKLIGWASLFIVGINTYRGIYSFVSGSEIELFQQTKLQVLFLAIFLITAFTFPLLFLFILQEGNIQQLNKLNTTKDKFFRIIGHDLKVPISQMIQLSHLMEQKYKDLSEEEAIKFIKWMKESSSMGGALLENLLDWARSQTGTIPYVPELLSLDDLIKDNLKLLARNAEKKHLQISVDCDTHYQVMADKNMINTILRNLITNAIKYSYSHGQIDIVCTKDKNHYIFSIRDYGLGMTEETQHNLFKIDTNRSANGTYNEKGTGIGLILCKEFIDKHKGDIWVISRLNKGSTFNFSIPKIPKN